MEQDDNFDDLLCFFAHHDDVEENFLQKDIEEGDYVNEAARKKMIEENNAQKDIEEGDYEAARNKRIQDNHALLESLGINSTKAALTQTANKSPKKRAAMVNPITKPNIPMRGRLERKAKRNSGDGIYGEDRFWMAPPHQPYSKNPAVLESCVDVLDPAYKEPELQPMCDTMIGCSSSLSANATLSVPHPAPDEDRDAELRAGLGSAFVTPQQSGLCSLVMTPLVSVSNSPQKAKAMLGRMKSKSPEKFVLRMSGLAKMASKSPEKRTRESLAFAACLPDSMSQDDVVAIRQNLMRNEFNVDRERVLTRKESEKRGERNRVARSVNRIDGRKVAVDLKQILIPDRHKEYCNCAKSGCTNNNCECVKQGRPCNELCKCCGREWCCDMFGNKRHCKNRNGVMLSKNSQEYSEMLQNKYFPKGARTSSINSKRTLDMSNFDGNPNPAFSLLADFALRASMPPVIVSGPENVAEKEEVSSSKEPAMGSTIPPRTHHDVSKSCFEKVNAFRDSIKDCIDEEEIDAKCEAFLTPLKEMTASMDKIWSDLPKIAPNEMNGLDERVQEFYRHAAQILSHTAAMDDAIVLVDKSLAMAKTQVRTHEKSICYKLKGIICTKQKKYKQAIHFFRACLKNKKRMNKQHTTDYKKIKKEIKAIKSAFLS